MKMWVWVIYIIIYAWSSNVRSDDVDAGCFKPIKNSLTHLGVFNDVKFINGFFRVVDSNGFVLSSKDGKTWLLNAIDRYGLNSIFWNGEKYIVTDSSKEIFVSDDLKSWNIIDLSLIGGGNSHIDKVFIHNNNYYLLDSSERNMSLIMEYWGVSYNKRGMFSLDESKIHSDERFFYGDDIYNLNKGGLIPASRDVMMFDDKFYLLTRGRGVYISGNLEEWKYMGGKKQPRGYSQSLTHNKSVIVSVGDFGYISTSSDYAKNWKVQKLNTEADLYDVIWDGKEFIAVGNCGTVAKSKNGYDWSFKSTGKSDFYTSIAYNGETYMIVGAGSGEKKFSKIIGKMRQRVFISVDGEAWEDYTDKVLDLYRNSEFSH